MSFDHLMQHAADIQRKAIEVALKEHHLDPHGRHPVHRTDAERVAARQTEQRIRGVLFEDIPELFQPFVDTPDPAGFDAAISYANGAADLLSLGGYTDPTLEDRQITDVGGPTYLGHPVLAEYNNVRESLSRWQGEAAGEFRRAYLNSFEVRLSNQFQVAIAVRAALEAEREIWKRTRTDVDNLAHGILHALDALDAFCTKDEWTMTFTVTASIVSVGATVVSPLAGAVTLAIIGGASQVAAAAPFPEADKQTYSAKTAEGVIDNLREAITRLRLHIADQEQVIAGKLTGNQDVVAGSRNSLLAPRPALADATRATMHEELGDFL